MIKFVDPRGVSNTAVEPYTLSRNLRAEGDSDITVGLLANGFPDSETFIRKIGDAIQKRLPNVRTMVWNKGNAGVEASDALADEIIADCQVVIAAYGH